jgi:hypothetical protein
MTLLEVDCKFLLPAHARRELVAVRNWFNWPFNTGLFTVLLLVQWSATAQSAILSAHTWAWIGP